MSETLTDQSVVQDDVQTAAEAAIEDALNKLGTQAADESKALGRTLGDSDERCKSIAHLCLEARLVIPKQLSNGIWVHDWDGSTARYRAWYDAHVMAVLQEQAPVVTFNFTRDDGAVEEKAIGDTDWVQRAQRSIRYYVAEYRGDFMREHGFENEASKFPTPLDLEKPSVKAAQRYAKQRAAAANPTPPSERVKDIVTNLDESKENVVLVLDMGRSIMEQLDERLSVEVIDSLNKRQSQKVASTIAAIQKIGDGIVQRMDRVERGELKVETPVGEEASV